MRRSCVRSSPCAVAAAVASSVLAVSIVSAQPSGRELETSVRQAALATYFHGITEEIALREVGRDGAPVLLRLLAEPGFPRRDNVVALLGYLAPPGSTDAVSQFLQNPPASFEVAEEDRALLLAPQTLGQLSRRGDRHALDTLLDMTAIGSEGGMLAAAAKARGVPGLRDDLLEMALRGLAWSGAPEARARLEAIAEGTLLPCGHGRSLRRAARNALDIAIEIGEPQPGASRPATALPGVPVPDGSLPSGLAGVGPGARPSTTAVDAQLRVHQAGLTYANHAVLTNPMSDSRLDQLLEEGSLRVGRSDFAEDVACCATYARSGGAKTFGVSGDGLDSIDDDPELRSVLNNTVARVKVVRLINYCGSPGSNIIGCAWVGGNGMALVRMSAIGSETVLWVHEYGHNTGLSHAADSRYIMYGVDYGTNHALTQVECDKYHQPAGGSGMATADVGACGDSDLDGVHDVVDNCPTTANAGQADTNGDGVGDACSLADSDGDGVADNVDCAPADASASVQPAEVGEVLLGKAASTRITWNGQGSGFRYDVAGDTLDELRSPTGVAGAACDKNDVAGAEWDDTRSGPSVGTGWYYLLRAQNACGSGAYGRSSGGADRVPTSACP